MIIIRNLGDSVVLVVGTGGEAIGCHDISHELGHVVPGNTPVHGGCEAGVVYIVGIEADVVPDAVVLQREIIGIERAEGLHRVGAVLSDVAGIERSGQHDGKV